MVIAVAWNSAFARNSKGTGIAVEHPFHSVGKLSGSGYVENIGYHRHWVICFPFSCNIFRIRMVFGEVGFGAKEHSVMVFKVAVPGGVHVVIFIFKTDYVPGVGLYFNVTCHAFYIAAIHAQFEHHSVIKSCIALAYRVFQDNRRIGGMAKLVFIVVFVIEVILDVFGYPIIGAFDFFIIRKFPKVEFGKDCVNLCINLCFLFRGCKPVESIGYFAVGAAFIFAGDKVIIISNLVVADIVALVRNTGVFPRFCKNRRNFG